jgi:hypothetical protein
LPGIFAVVALAGIVGATIYRSRIRTVSGLLTAARNDLASLPMSAADARAITQNPHATAADRNQAGADLNAAAAAAAAAAATADAAQARSEADQLRANQAELLALTDRRSRLTTEQSLLRTTLAAEQTDLNRIQGTLRNMRNGWPPLASRNGMTPDRVLGATIHDDGSAEPSGLDRATIDMVADANRNMPGSTEAFVTIARFVGTFDAPDLPASTDSLWVHYRALRSAHADHVARDESISTELAGIATRVATITAGSTTSTSQGDPLARTGAVELNPNAGKSPIEVLDLAHMPVL